MKLIIIRISWDIPEDFSSIKKLSQQNPNYLGT